MAKQEVVADRVGGEDHDPSQHPVVKGWQHELQQQQERRNRQMHAPDQTVGAGQRRRFPAQDAHRHRRSSPNSPIGLSTRTKTTSSEATILASVGVKKTDMTPSLRPMKNAPTSVPVRLPTPPMITAMNESSRGSRPIR